jgi:hypothetical protein
VFAPECDCLLWQYESSGEWKTIATTAVVRV